MASDPPAAAPRPRSAVDGIPAYVAGRRAPSRPGLTTYKMSSNENPHPPLDEVVEAAITAVRQMNRYPDMGSARLYDALAQRFDIGADRLAVATGSVALIYHLIQAYCEPGDEIVYAWRSFEAYPIAAQAAGARTRAIPLTSDGGHDLGAMADAVGERTRLVMLCTPNNPTGPALTHTQVSDFLSVAPEHVLVVVDEAYAEFVRMPDPVDGLRLGHDPRVVVLRTFSKAYGLAGLRAGFAIADPSVATAVRAVSLPFGVSSVAQAAAVAALQHEAELMARVDGIVAERDRVAAGLAAAGWRIPDAQGNFVWLPLGERAADFAAAAEEVGLVVRAFAADGVRVAIDEPSANDRFLDLAESWLR